MENLVMRPVWAQSGSELLATLDTVTAAESLLATYKLQAIQRLEKMGTAQELGARDTSELLSLRYRLNRTDVRKDLTLAAALPKYPAVTAALPDPDNPTRPAALSVEQARVIVGTLEKAPSSVPVENLQVAEEQMVQAARVATPRDLTNLGHKVLATLDTDGPEPAEDDARTRESLRLRRADGGVKFTGFLAAENAELFETQIHKLSKPHKTIDGELDPRPRTKRQADALTTICEAAAGNPDYPGVPHLTVTIDFEDLKSALSPAGSRGTRTSYRSTGPGTSSASGGSCGAGRSCGSVPPNASYRPSASDRSTRSDTSCGSGTSEASSTAWGSAGPAASRVAAASCPSGESYESVGPAPSCASGASCPSCESCGCGCDAPSGAEASYGSGELVFGGNLSASAVRRLACDAGVLPIILGSSSQALDLDTEQRFVNRTLRRALNRRDKGCVVCQAPPWMCHAHHIVHWADGGPTSLDNLALVCSAHHRAIHAGQWTITITDSTVQITRPTWADPPPTPNPVALTTLAAHIGWPTPALNPTHGAPARHTEISANPTYEQPAQQTEISANPIYEQPARLPAASTLPNPTLVAAREALRARLTSLTPNHHDPWTTPAPIP